jgi:hypothetical protein
MFNFEGGIPVNLSVEGQTIDASSIPGLQQEIMQIVAQHMNDPQAMRTAIRAKLADAGLIPESARAVPPELAGTPVFGVGAVPGVAGAPPAAPAPAPAPAELPVATRLQKLEELRQQGLITDAEYAAQRERILKSL